MAKEKNELLDALIAENLLTPEAAAAWLKEAAALKRPLADFLVSRGVVSEDRLVAVQGKILKMPVADLKGRLVPRAVLNLIPRQVAENYQIVAFEKTGNEVRVGLVDPKNFKAIEAVEFLAQKAGWEVKFFLAAPGSFKNILRQYQVMGEEVEEALAGFGQEVGALQQSAAELKQMEEVVKSAPVSKIVLVIMKHAIDGRASDIHIEPTLHDTQIRYRIDGILRTSLVLPKYIHAAIVARIKVLSNLKLDETRKPQDGRIRITFEGREIDFRVSTLPLFEGEKVVLRILDTSAQVPQLEQLGFNPVHIEIIKKSIGKPHGLTLLTGPTGSGKTTTLYTVLMILNREGINIITLEDPIEYYINGVNQSQINPDIGYNFAAGFRAILRQDPNIVMLGEIRDTETTELVIHAGLSGHMILSTLHTNDAIGAIPRLIDMGAEPFLLSSVINIIIAQRLARKICPDCKKETLIPPAVMKRIKELLINIPPPYLEGINTEKMVFYKGEGCAHCGNLGYQGRIAVSEIIDITPEIREIINNGGSVLAVKKVLDKQQDFISLVQDCLLKALRGITTVDEIIRVAQL